MEDISEVFFEDFGREIWYLIRFTLSLQPEKMFEDCTGLKKAYVKAAYTINNFECYDMFSGCTNLDDGRKFYSSDAATYITELLSYWLAEDYE